MTEIPTVTVGISGSVVSTIVYVLVAPSGKSREAVEMMTLAASVSTVVAVTLATIMTGIVV